MNTDKYLDKVFETSDGMVYRTDKPMDKVSDNEIIYIPETSIKEMFDYKVINIDIDDESLVNDFECETKTTIIKKIQKAFGYSIEEINQHNMVETVIKACSSECVDTLLDRIEKDELLSNDID